MNVLNAGCVNIVEDSLAHRTAFQDGRNPLFFRYEDDSLRECFKLVIAARVADACPDAELGLGLRDEQSFLFGAFHNIVAPRSRLNASSRLSRRRRHSVKALTPLRREQKGAGFDRHQSANPLIALCGKMDSEVPDRAVRAIDPARPGDRPAAPGLFQNRDFILEWK